MQLRCSQSFAARRPWWGTADSELRRSSIQSYVAFCFNVRVTAAFKICHEEIPIQHLNVLDFVLASVLFSRLPLSIHHFFVTAKKSLSGSLEYAQLPEMEEMFELTEKAAEMISAEFRRLLDKACGGKDIPSFEPFMIEKKHRLFSTVSRFIDTGFFAADKTDGTLAGLKAVSCMHADLDKLFATLAEKNEGMEERHVFCAARSDEECGVDGKRNSLMCQRC